MQKFDYSALISLICNDPNASDYYKKYAKEKLPEYFSLLKEKNGSFIQGLLASIESFLKL